MSLSVHFPRASCILLYFRLPFYQDSLTLQEPRYYYYIFFLRLRETFCPCFSLHLRAFLAFLFGRLPPFTSTFCSKYKKRGALRRRRRHQIRSLESAEREKINERHDFKKGGPISRPHRKREIIHVAGQLRIAVKKGPGQSL